MEGCEILRLSPGAKVFAKRVRGLGLVEVVVAGAVADSRRWADALVPGDPVVSFDRAHVAARVVGGKVDGWGVALVAADGSLSGWIVAPDHESQTLALATYRVDVTPATCDGETGRGVQS